MKNTFYLLLLSILVSACSINKEPVFKKVDNIKVISIASDTIRLKVDVFFENPNDVGGKIFTDEIRVNVNGAEVAQVSSDEFKVPSRKEFSIPLKIVIPARKIYQNNKGGILGGLINSVLSKSVKVSFKGNLEYRFLGFKKQFPINEIREIKF